MDCKNLTLKANSLTSAGDITGVDTLTLTVNQTLNNQANGKLLSAGVLTLKADSVTNDGQLQEMPPPSRQDNSQTAGICRAKR